MSQVLINKDTGFAEQFTPEQAQAATVAGTHYVPLVDETGEVTSVPMDEATRLVQQGYRAPAPEQLQKLVDHTKYSSTGEQLKTFAENLASGATAGLTSAALANEIPGYAEAKLARQEVNPGIAALGEGAGFVGSMLTGVGEGALALKAGEAAAAKLGFQATGLGRVGSAATKATVENMVMQAGSEADKMFISDPHQSMETAAVNMGLSGVIGGLTGSAVSGGGLLWEMGPGKKLSALLDNVKNRAAGVPKDLQARAGLDLVPEASALLGDNALARTEGAHLLETNTFAGAKLQKVVDDVKVQLDNTLASTVGKTEAQIEELRHISDASQGLKLKEQIVKDLGEKFEPLAARYKAVEDAFQAAPLATEIQTKTAQRLVDLGAEMRLDKGINESAQNALESILAKLPKQETVQDLRVFANGIRDKFPFGSEGYQFAKKARAAIMESAQEAMQGAAEKAGPEAFQNYLAANAEYGPVRELLETLNDRLHVGKFSGEKSFATALKEMDPETIAKRLSVRGDTELQQVLTQQFPQIAEQVKQYERDLVLKKALNLDKDGISIKKLTGALESMQPEAREFLFGKEALERVEALRQLDRRIADLPRNNSKTAKTLDKIYEFMPASAGAVGAMLLGHNPVAGLLLGGAAQLIGKETPDAIRLGLLKFLGAGAPTNSGAFAALVKTIAQVQKGEKLVGKAVSAVFTGARVELPALSARDRDKLKKQVEDYSAGKLDLLNGNDVAGHYAPEHSTAKAMLASKALDYLSKQRPSTAPLSPLGPDRKPSATELAKYENALTVAQQPLTVLEKLEKGTLTAQDLQHMQALYPALFQKLSSKLMEQAMDQKAKGGIVPYKVKAGLSAFLGQPLDASLYPQSLQATQATFMPAAPSAPPQGPSPSATSMQNLIKMPKSYLTPQQAREAARLK